jgi:transcriptional regulator
MAHKDNAHRRDSQVHNYPPFEMKDDAEKTAFVAARRFANLVVSGPDGPVAAHVPLLLQVGEGGMMLEGHVSRSNPLSGLAQSGVRALAIFNGVDAYVTPSAYPSKKLHGKVAPTWNYIAVQAKGSLEAFNDAVELRDHLERLTNELEGSFLEPWAVSDAPVEFTARLIGGITGVRMRVESLEGIRKLNQNNRQPDREGVRAFLSQSDDAMARLVASEMSTEP